MMAILCVGVMINNDDIIEAATIKKMTRKIQQFQYLSNQMLPIALYSND